MADICDDPFEPYERIKNVLMRDDIGIDLIFNELSAITDFKDQKSVVDSLIREQILLHITELDVEKIEKILEFSIELLHKELVNSSLPFLLFSDIFNSLTIQKCEEFFGYMEECVNKLKDTPVFVSGRTMLLRICNDLIRRLSKTQDTVFCGRIQIFLSRLFPLDEKSGLNLMGHFNIDNVTPYSTGDDEEDESSLDITTNSNLSILGMDDDGIGKTTPKFYRQFWSLQNYFRFPNQVYMNSDKFSEFSTDVSSVLNFFCKIRYKAPKNSRIKDSSSETDGKCQWDGFTTADITFTKYLTNQKLFDLQLVDIGFRRCFLLQLSVLFQYLLLEPCKFKTSDQVLSELEKKWVLEKQEDTFNLIKEMSSEPDEPFYDVVQNVLYRESVKSQWKQDGCQSFVNRSSETNGPQQLWNPRDLKINRLKIDPETGNREVCFDKLTELGRLWRLSPDPLAACRTEERVSDTAKTLQLNLQKIQEEIKLGQCKKLDDEKWVWGLLRLLSRKSAYFYNNWASPGQHMSVYLNDIIKQESQPYGSSNIKPCSQNAADSLASEDFASPSKKAKLSPDNERDQESSKEKIDNDEQDNSVASIDNNNVDDEDEDEEIVDGEVGNSTGVDESEDVSDSEMPDPFDDDVPTTECGEIQD